MKRTLWRILERHPIASFMILAYTFSWWMWPLYALQLSPATIAGFGPFFAALVVLGVTGGKPAVRALFRQMVHWRVGLRWYAVALGMPLIFSGTAALLNVLLGAPAPSTQQLAQWPSILPAFLMFLLVPGIGGTWEEPGWRGYALPQLATRHSQMVASLLLAVAIVGWHLPLFLNGIIPWGDVLFILGTVLIFNWVYYQTHGSVLIIMLFHAMNNAVGQYFPALFSAPYSARFALLQGEICLVIALCMVVATSAFWTTRPTPQPFLRSQASESEQQPVL
jgi:uncharacterized protein